MNQSQLAFVVHDGDIKGPTSACSTDLDRWVKDKFNRSTAPFVYAVGDNEWMDCNNANNAAPMDNLVALDELREVFYPDDASLGANRMPLTNQRVWDGTPPKPDQPHSYPENARWTKEGVVFATLNAPGPSDDIKNTDESYNRRAANLDWLNKTFDQAVATNAPGVMIIWQADPWYVSPTGIDFGQTWAYLKDALKQRTIAFGKPVVLVHGDTHIFRIDKGGWPDGTGAMKGAWDDVPNFTRVETHGLNSDAVRWVKATVNPADPKVFTFKSMDAS
jgi:hypothetical protein